MLKHNPMLGEKWRPALPDVSKKATWYKTRTDRAYIKKLQAKEKSGWSFLDDGDRSQDFFNMTMGSATFDVPSEMR